MSSRRKERPLNFRTEGAALLCCGGKEQRLGLELRLLIHFACMERAIHYASHILAPSLLTVTYFKVKSAKPIRSQQVCAEVIESY